MPERIIVRAPSPVGPPGPTGTNRLFVQPTFPTTVPEGEVYLLVQTGLGLTGDDMTFWVEDGT